MCRSFSTKISLKTELYLIAYEIYLIRGIVIGSSLIGDLLPDFMSQLMYYMIFLFLGLRFLVTRTVPKYSFRKFIAMFLIVMAITFFSKDMEMLAIFLLALSAYDIPFEKIAKRTAIVLVLSILLVVASCQLGIIENRIFWRKSIKRQSLGFVYVGTLDSYLLHFTLIITYLLKEKINYIFLLIIAGISYIVFGMTNVRGAFYGECIILILTLFSIKWDFKIFDFRKKYWRLIATILFPLCFFVSLITAIVYNNGNTLMIGLDYLLSNRIKMCSEAINKYGLTIFGQKIRWVGMNAVTFGNYTRDQYNYVDNGYILTLLQYGIIAIVIICFAYTLFFRKASEEDNKGAYIWLIYIALSCIVYPNLFSYQNNCLFICCLSFLIRGNISYATKHKGNNIERY